MSAEEITLVEFREKLSKYPALIETFSRPAKDGHLSLEQLDQFRYIDAPVQFSKKAGGRTMELPDIQKLVDWKIRHGVFRPTLPKLVASNDKEAVETALTAAFRHHAEDSSDLEPTIKKISTLRGVGPATASLILAVHDPEHVIFFSDESYRWLCKSGEKVELKYNFKEFNELSGKSKALSAKLNVSLLDIEKVAFVIMKEDGPIKEGKPEKVPSGRPRGRPRLPDDQKKPPKESSGRGRGRPKGSFKTDKAVPKTPRGTGKRGRPAGSTKRATKNEEVEKSAESSTVQHPASPAKRKANEDVSNDVSSKKAKA